MRIIFLAFAALVAIASSENDVPTYPDSYSIEGTIYLPYAEIREPFKAWLDGPNKRSRVDYYDTVKTYQIENDKDNKSRMYKITPATTNTQYNVIACFKLDGGEGEQAVHVQSVIPDLTGFKNAGRTNCQDDTCDMYQKIEKVDNKINRYTFLCVRTQDGKSCIPKSFSMLGYDNVFGSHFDQYFMEYHSYNSDAPNDDIFDEPDADKCGGFPGPGNDLHGNHYSFNPMSAWVHNDRSHHKKAFENFKNEHNVDYDTEHEHNKRENIFKHNFEKVASINRQNRGFVLKANKLADRTKSERALLNGRKSTPIQGASQHFPLNNLIATNPIPDDLDWRIAGAVDSVKDQAICGSCWAFGTTGTIEGAYFLKYGHRIRLSQQNLVDCSWGFGNNACDGGEEWRAYNWMMHNGGLMTEHDYGRYLGQNGWCHYNSSKETYELESYSQVHPAGDEEALKVAVAQNGPVAVGIHVADDEFSFFSSGVYKSTKCGNKVENLNHGVLVVGYGTLNGEDYWLIKNSWSTYWGNDGYILVARNNNNMCGLATQATFVTLKDEKH